MACEYGIGKTVLDIASLKDKTTPMYERINSLIKMDEMLNFAKDANWIKCEEVIQERPKILNEKPPYRKFYLLHHLAYSGAFQEFEHLHEKYHFNLNLVVATILSSRLARNISVCRSNSTTDVTVVRNLAGDVLLNTNDNSLTTFSVENNSSSNKNAISYDYIRQMTDRDLLNAITDPITKQILRNPVLASDGYTYERESIMEWFRLCKNSPVTNVEFINFDLKPNNVILRMLKVIQSRSDEIQNVSAANEARNFVTQLPISYTVEEGDTLHNIAISNNFTLDEMKAANPDIENYNFLRIGQKIKLPGMERRL
ncbi:unnamed protein product [Didymodactylos carnosus]|uniref:Uncharacterized protein n=1 Tax=Didymodactylos carnosus TaxID=1234261 RepID=A0A8S2LF30_9BILA|nr:unnamed protein product [Didymodactylos carnosus]CAF3903326.1 unnamed protein product [Didymodactylos carnosus]